MSSRRTKTNNEQKNKTQKKDEKTKSSLAYGKETSFYKCVVSNGHCPKGGWGAKAYQDGLEHFFFPTFAWGCKGLPR